MALPTHLSEADIEEFGREIEAIRRDVVSSLGAQDRAYIVSLIRKQRVLALSGRLVMLAAPAFLPAFGLVDALLARGSARFDAGLWPFFALLGLGMALLGVAKILENMEIGHNVLHGQWDWMRDPDINSRTWEWDGACPAVQWRHSHNFVHHTWTNVIGKDHDVGYGILRVSPDQPWRWRYALQPLNNLLLMLFFEWGVALHDLEPERILNGEKSVRSILPELKVSLKKVALQGLKDYVAWPSLTALVTLGVALPLGISPAVVVPITVLSVAVANFGACVIRNVWSNMIIFCGHFPAGVHHFTPDDLMGETRARCYVRQLMGSCNISGGKLLHLMSGNLSHQIEHHLFPDMPSNRYVEIAPRVRALAARFRLPYNTGSLLRQYGTTTLTIWRLWLPLGGKSSPQTQSHARA